MAGVARLAVELGHRVSGADQALYPPMSTQLDALGIEVVQGYDATSLVEPPDLVVIGNALSRGNAAVEFVLSNDLPFVSGPEWLERFVLPGRHVLALAGTHGKTTVSSLVSWIMDSVGLDPGFLVGGVLENLGLSARLGSGRHFIIEADEYDTAFFDKRSKFIHYHPRTLVINNLEFDHADIFPDLAAIQRQFHHLVRTLPAEARILRPAPQSAIDEVLNLGCWSKVSSFGMTPDCDWQFDWHDGAKRTLALTPPQGDSTIATTPLMGLHNAWNVTAAVCAVADVGVDVADALAALTTFANVRRRLERRGERNGITVYDDFAHHPTAIAATIAALRGSVGKGRIIALLELRSNSMVMGVHKASLGASIAQADSAAILVPNDLPWNIRAAMDKQQQIRFYTDASVMAREIAGQARAGDHILIMSNGAFANIHDQILEQL